MTNRNLKKNLRKVKHFKCPEMDQKDLNILKIKTHIGNAKMQKISSFYRHYFMNNNNNIIHISQNLSHLIRSVIIWTILINYYLVLTYKNNNLYI